VALPQPRGATAAGLDTLRRQFAPSATDEELGYFAQVSRHLDVDPWAGHICLVAYQGVHRPQLTVAGRRFIAQRTGRLRGISGPHWCGPRRYTNAGAKVPLEWLEVWDEDGPPYAARCLVFVDGWDVPANGTVKWDELSQTYKDKKTGALLLTPAWEKMPSHMLGKTAESLALRRGFSEVQAAVSYLGGDDEDATMVREVAAEVLAPAPQDRGESRGDAAGDVLEVPGRSPAAHRRRYSDMPRGGDDEVPEWVRDRDAPR
jgi:hypothetical protein